MGWKSTVLGTWNQPRVGAGGALQGIWEDPREGNWGPTILSPAPSPSYPGLCPNPSETQKGAPGKEAAGTELPGTITVFILIKPHFHSN